MAQIIVCSIEEAVKVGLEARASQHGWSMEEEVRQIFRAAVSAPEPARIKLGSSIAARFTGNGLTEALSEFHGQQPEPMSVSA